MQSADTAKETAPVIRVLLVDDEDQFRSALARQLKVRNHMVWDVSKGEDAIQLVKRNQPEVVILDQKMPGMDGIQTLKEIKKALPETQVIMLTGHGDTESARITGKFGVFKYMQKPCGIDELTRNIAAAREEHVNAMAARDVHGSGKGAIWRRLAGAFRRG